MVPGHSLTPFRFLLLPFSLLYWVGISVRNWLYDRNILKSSSFGLPLICVGNLAVGGTGKSPMVEYLLEHLKDKFELATLSRGYKRKTKGYALAHENSNALEIGDEPMQFHLKFPGVTVAVGEERVAAIPQLLHDRPGTQAVILDDAFQHRSISAGLNILLTEYNNLFTQDLYLPAGNLRDLKRNYKRAQVIVVTKCDPAITRADGDKVINSIHPQQGQEVYFTALDYGLPYHILDRHTTTIDEQTAVLLVTGIANPAPLQRMLESCTSNHDTIRYSDHHIFSIDDLKNIRKRFAALKDRAIILSTEKDAVRLVKFREDITGLPLYIIPVKHRFLFDQGEAFNRKITEFISNFKKSE